jgi:hypothetical protein
LADGPLQFDQVDKETFVPNMITKYGKEFSIVEVPYCLKLLMHELTTMNVQMRLITADTIDSLTTAGKRSLGNFKTWSKKEAPEEPIEKAKIEKLLNQTLSEEEYQAIVEPGVEAPEIDEMVEYVPKTNQNDEPMVLQPLEFESDSEEEGPRQMPQVPMTQAPISKAPMSQAPTEMSQTMPEPMPPSMPEPLSESGEATEVVEPKKDVKKISFKM